MLHMICDICHLDYNIPQIHTSAWKYSSIHPASRLSLLETGNLERGNIYFSGRGINFGPKIRQKNTILIVTARIAMSQSWRFILLLLVLCKPPLEYSRRLSGTCPTGNIENISGGIPNGDFICWDVGIFWKKSHAWWRARPYLNGLLAFIYIV